MRVLERTALLLLHFFHPYYCLFHGQDGLNKAGLRSVGIQYPFSNHGPGDMAQQGRLGMVHLVFFVNAARLIQGCRGQSEMLHLIGLGPLDGMAEGRRRSWTNFPAPPGYHDQELCLKSEAMISAR